MVETIVHHRLCSKCKEPKPFDNFGKCAADPLGYKRLCKQCNSVYHKERRKALRVAGLKLRPKRVYVTEKSCPHCKTIKPSTDFTNNKASRDGLAAYCRTCKKVKSKEWFQLNYKPTIKTELIPIDHPRTCVSCRQHLDAEQFYLNPKLRNGRGASCKPCEREMKTRYEKSERGVFRRLKRRRDPETKLRVIKWRRKRLYGLTDAAYNAMLLKQYHKCAICRLYPATQLAVDHDHQTGRVRGLLCNLCNSILGRWRDSPEIAERAKQYLLAHQQLALIA